MSQLLKRLGAAIPKVTRTLADAKPVDMYGDYRKNYKFKTKFGLLGPVSAGKSTLCASIVETCEDQSATDTNFYARVLPSSSNILRDANRQKKDISQIKQIQQCHKHLKQDYSLAKQE